MSEEQLQQDVLKAKKKLASLLDRALFCRDTYRQYALGCLTIGLSIVALGVEIAVSNAYSNFVVWSALGPLAAFFILAAAFFRHIGSNQNTWSKILALAYLRVDAENLARQKRLQKQSEKAK